MASKRKQRPQLGAGEARAALRELASGRQGVLWRREVVQRGVPRWIVQLELRVGRWQATGRQTVVTHNGPVTPAQERAVAAIEVGPRAVVDGITALQHHGVDIKGDGSLHVLAAKGSTPKRPAGVTVHESRRYDEDDVVLLDGVRVTRPAVAAVHAAIWASSDRQAKLYLIVVVQQRRATAPEVREAVEKLRRCRRRSLMLAVVQDLDAGVRSLPELDFARALRRRGLPEPDRQVSRQRATGEHYLDCRFDRLRLTVEIDGAQHDAPEQRVVDALRDLASAAEGDAVVRIPSLALRLDEERVMRGLEDVFLARGWRRAA